MDKNSKTKTDTCGRVPGKNYVGCLRKVFFNDRNMIYAVKNGLHGYRKFGNMSYTCNNNDEKSKVISLTHESSQLTVNILKRGRNSFVMVMRTFESRGHVFTHKATGMLV